MHRDPFSNRNERRVESSDRAKAAAARWVADNGGEEAIERRIASGGGFSTSDLDAMVRGWQIPMITKGTDRIRDHLANERVRQLRHARRQLRLSITIFALSVAWSAGIICWYLFIANH